MEVFFPSNFSSVIKWLKHVTCVSKLCLSLMFPLHKDIFVGLFSKQKGFAERDFISLLIKFDTVFDKTVTTVQGEGRKCGDSFTHFFIIS